MMPKTVSQRLAERKRYDRARSWFVSYGRKLKPAMERVRDRHKAEAKAMNISQAEYLIRILDGLGKRGRKEAYAQGAMLGAKDDAGRGE